MMKVEMWNLWCFKFSYCLACHPSIIIVAFTGRRKELLRVQSNQWWKYRNMESLMFQVFILSRVPSIIIIAFTGGRKEQKFNIYFIPFRFNWVTTNLVGSGLRLSFLFPSISPRPIRLPLPLVIGLLHTHYVKITSNKEESFYVLAWEKRSICDPNMTW